MSSSTALLPSRCRPGCGTPLARSPVRRSEHPGQAGRPGRAGQDESRQEDLQDAVSMAEAGVNLDMRHALDRTRVVSERERGGLPW